MEQMHTGISSKLKTHPKLKSPGFYMESQTVWAEGDLKAHLDHLLPWTSPTQTWPWTFPGMQHLPLLLQLEDW